MFRQKIDFYSVQFSGATGHPVCFNLSKKEKELISKKVSTKLDSIMPFKILKPEYYFPLNWTLCSFLDKDLSLGKNNIFIHQPELVKFLEKLDTKIVCETRRRVY